MRKISSLLVLLFVFCASTNAQTDSLQQYTGNFLFPEGSVITYTTVTVDKGALFFTSDRGSGALIKIASDTFSIPSYSGTAFFVRDSSKRITGIIIDAMGYHLVGVKQAVSVAWNNRKKDPFKKEEWLFHL